MSKPSGDYLFFIAALLFAIIAYTFGIRLEQTLPETAGILLMFILLSSKGFICLYQYIVKMIFTSARYVQLIFTLSILIIYMILIGTGFSLLWIRHDIKTQCMQAKKEYNADCVTSLLQLAGDTKRSYYARNNAIWALGQLGDVRALRVLGTLYTGTIPAREPYNEVLSQYELRKAIQLLSGGVNIGSHIWRHGIE